ncbi:hypothetical protein ACLB2K_043887 [Fragaria x ananassa]
MAAGGACPLDGLLSAEHAEVLACRHAVDFAVKHGFSQVILEIDAQEVRRQLNSSSPLNTSVLGPIYDDLRCIFEVQRCWKINHFSRNG